MRGGETIDWTGAGRILVRAPNWVGDAVMALPLLDAIRAAAPDARLDVLGIPWVEGLVAFAPCVSGFVRFDRKGEGRGFAGMERAASRIREARYDVAISLPRSLSSAWVLHRARVPVRVGYATQGRGWLLTHAVPFAGKHQPGLHDVELYGQLGEAVGLPPVASEPRLVASEAHRERASEILAASGLEGRPYAVIAPGAAFGGAKRYPAPAFAAVADALGSDPGLEIVLVGSPGERPIALDVMRLVATPAVDLVGRIGLDESLAILAGARAAVTNDSGLMHAAAALGVPLVTPFGPTDPVKTGPRGAYTRVVQEPVSCAPCFLRECPIDQRCMTRIAPERIVREVRDLVARRWGAPR